MSFGVAKRSRSNRGRNTTVAFDYPATPLARQTPFRNPRRAITAVAAVPVVQYANNVAPIRANAALYNRYGFYSAGQQRQNRLMEHKSFDYNPTGAIVAMQTGMTVALATTPFAPTSTTSGGCINQIPRDTSSITRIGRRLNLTAVAIRGFVVSGVTATYAKCTMLLIWDRTPNQNAALPPWTSILTQQNSYSLTNKDNAPRFKILRRWDYCLVGDSDSATSVQDSTVQTIEEYVTLKNKVTVFTTADTTGLYPDMMEGGLLLYVTSNIVDGTAAPQVVVNTRVYYNDS